MKFDYDDEVVYQGQAVRITDLRPKTRECRLAFNRVTYTEFKWVCEDELTPLIERTPLAGGTEIESVFSKVIVIVLNDGTLSIDGPFKLTTLDELRIFNLQIEEAEIVMQERLREAQS